MRTANGRWIPDTTDELIRALESGSIAEDHFTDVKRELPPPGDAAIGPSQLTLPARCGRRGGVLRVDKGDHGAFRPRPARWIGSPSGSKRSQGTARTLQSEPASSKINCRTNQGGVSRRFSSRQPGRAAPGRRALSRASRGSRTRSWRMSRCVASATPVPPWCRTLEGSPRSQIARDPWRRLKIRSEAHLFVVADRLPHVMECCFRY